MARKRLTDILQNSERDRLEENWDMVTAAEELKPLPGGEYRARILKAELFAAKSGTPGYKITFEVLDGDHRRRKFWHDVWLSAPALAIAKRDLSKLGITNPSQLERPLPEGIVVVALVALRRDETRAEHNS